MEYKNNHIITPLQEQDGAWSMRRLLAFICIANAVKISWNPATPYLSILVFVLAACLFLGFTTFQEIRALMSYKIADAISNTRIDSATDEDYVVGFKQSKGENDENSNTHRR